MWFLLLPNVFVVIKYFSLCLLLLFYVLQLAAIFFRWLCVDACDEGSEGRENRFFLQATSWLIANQRQFKGNKKYLFEINFFLFLLACLLACFIQPPSSSSRHTIQTMGEDKLMSDNDEIQFLLLIAHYKPNKRERMKAREKEWNHPNEDLWRVQHVISRFGWKIEANQAESSSTMDAGEIEFAANCDWNKKLQ